NTCHCESRHTRPILCVQFRLLAGFKMAPMPEKVAAITGSSAGIGRSIAIAPATKNSVVIGNARHEVSRAENLLSDWRPRGQHAGIPPSASREPVLQEAGAPRMIPENLPAASVHSTIFESHTPAGHPDL